MNQTKRQKVCDAYNRLLQLEKVHPNACYQIIDSNNRDKFEKDMYICGLEFPPGYSREKEYVIIWVPVDPTRPFRNAELIEVGDLISEAEKDKVGKGILQ